MAKTKIRRTHEQGAGSLQTLPSAGVGASSVEPTQIAPGVHFLEVGKGIMRSNVYFVRSGASWVLIDTASANCSQIIQEAAESLFGAGSCPVAILHTHGHPDHAGSTRELARRWGCLAYLHPDELRFVTTDDSTFFSTYEPYTTSSGRWAPPPLDRWVVLPMMRAMPRRRRESMFSDSSFKDVARAFDTAAGIPGLPDWECIPTPGHTPGHVAFFRPADRVLIAGDAVVTVDLNSLWGFMSWGLGRSKKTLGLPPWYTTWSWRAAKESAASVALLNPLVLATGHGLPMSGIRTAQELRDFADHFRAATG